MAIISKILNRVIVAQFYQRNAGLFLFIFIIMFGVIYPNEIVYYHLSLMHAMLGSPVFMTVVAGVWLVYAMKCAQFTMITLSEPRQQFFYVLSNLSAGNQFASLLAMQLFIYLPVLIYSVIVTGVGIYDGQYLPALFVITYNLLLCTACTMLYMRKLNHPNPEKTFFLSKIIRLRFAKPFPLFFISQLLNETKVIFVVTKFFSAIIILAFLNGFFLDSYDSRVVMLGFLAAMTAHCVMVFEFRKFEESFLGFYRNLPVSLFRRFLSYVIVYAIVLLPEWLIFSFAIPQTLKAQDALWLPFFGIGVLLLFHCLLYRPLMNIDRYLHWVFVIFAFLFFLILYKMYLLIDASLLLSSLFLFAKNYYRYERLEEVAE